MLLTRGQWLGKGSLLVEGASLGEEVEIDLGVEEDDAGVTLAGEISGRYKGALSIRVAPDETGTYTIDARVAGMALDGRAKLESEPHLVLLWNEAHTQSVAVTVFRSKEGIGCRGFYYEANQTRTWEVLFKLRQQVLGGGNVVSINRRR